MGELAFPRLASWCRPRRRRRSGHARAPALFPTEIGWLTRDRTDDRPGPDVGPLDQQAQVERLLAEQGKTLADVSLGFAFGIDPQYAISALRVKGADAAALLDPFLAMSGAVSAPEHVQVAGKEVLRATTETQTQHVYAKNDVIWVVVAEEPILTEAFQKLP